jgi:hypothetical protein
VKTVWLKLVQRSSAPFPGEAWCPDVPLDKRGQPSVAFSADIPCDLDEASPNYGKPLLSVCRVRIAEVQGDRSPDEKAPVPVLPLAEVSPSARDIAITMACSIPRIGPFVDGAQAREVFEDIVAQLARGQEVQGDRSDGDRHQPQVSVPLAPVPVLPCPLLQEALLQAARRGLRASDAEAIACDLGILI